MPIFNLSGLFGGKKDAGTASTAKERLQLIIAHESNGKTPDFLPKLQEELFEVISRYTSVSKDGVSLNIQRRGNTDILEMNLVLGDPLPAKPAIAKSETSAAALAARIIADDRAAGAPAAVAVSPAPPPVAEPAEVAVAIPAAPATVQPAARETVRLESSLPSRRPNRKRGKR